MMEILEKTDEDIKKSKEYFKLFSKHIVLASPDYLYNQPYLEIHFNKFIDAINQARLHYDKFYSLINRILSDPRFEHSNTGKNFYYFSFNDFFITEKDKRFFISVCENFSLLDLVSISDSYLTLICQINGESKLFRYENLDDPTDEKDELVDKIYQDLERIFGSKI